VFSGKKKEQIMKFTAVAKSAVLGLALLVAVSAFAGTKASLQITDPINVNGTTLKPGDYKVTWDGNGPNVEVSILQGKNVVAKVPARVVDLQAPSANNAAVIRKSDDGTNSLAGVRFEGKKFALELGDAGMQAGSSK
jgi:hypothetical protein